MSADPSGWMPGVEHRPTWAFSYPDMPDDSMYPLAIVSHVMQGYQSTMLQWADERPAVAQKSAHFTIGRDGRVVQHVSIWDAAWHAGSVNSPTIDVTQFPLGNPNRATIGIEHEGFSVPPGYGYDYVYDGNHPWPEALIRASIEVHSWIAYMCQNFMWLSASAALMHSQIDSINRRDDPGTLWRATVVPRLIQAIKDGRKRPSTVPSPEPEPAPEPEPPASGLDVDALRATLTDAASGMSSATTRIREAMQQLEGQK